MPLPSYTEIAKHPAFKDLPFEERVSKTQGYWDRYDQENPQDSEFSKGQRERSLSYLETKQRLEDASPIQRAFLEPEFENQKLNLAVTEGVRSGKISPEQAQGMVQQRKKQLGPIKESLLNLDKFRKGELEEDLQPTLKELDESARQGGVFGSATINARVSGILPGGDTDQVQKGKDRYAQARDGLSKTLSIALDLVDDIMKHRMGLQEKPVSRDALGVVHIKDDVLNQGSSEVVKAITASDLPDRVKKDMELEAPERVVRYKDSIIKSVKENHPELASEIKFTGNIDEDYKTITDQLNDSRTEQFGGGVAAYAAKRGKLLGEETSLSGALGFGKTEVENTKIVKDVEGNFVRFEKPETLEEKAAQSAKRQESLNNLSNEINQKKVQLWGTDAAIIGSGGASAVESIALGAATGGLGSAIVTADRIRRAGTVGKMALGFAQRAGDVLPVAGFYGADQALSTYESAIKSGKSPAEAAKLAALSGVIETGVTTLFSGVKLGGTETIGTKLASGVARETMKKSVGAAVLSFGKTVIGENLEELTINALDTVAVQAKLNPQMTVDDLKRSLYATMVATTLSTAPMGAISAGVDYKKAPPTAEQTTDQLHDISDATYQAAAKENIPPAEASGGTLKEGSLATVAELEQYRQEQIGLAENDEERQLLTEATPEELADQAGVKLETNQNEQDQQNTGGEQNATQTLQLPKVPVEQETPTDPVAPSSDQEAAQLAEAEVQGEVAAVVEKAKSNGVSLRVSETKSGINLEGIDTESDQRNQGKATQAISALKRVADEKQLPVVLRVDPSGDKSMSKEDLTEWYSKQGFELQDDGEHMVYTPEVDYDKLQAQDEALTANDNDNQQNDNQQPTESSQLQVPMPAVPGNELAADPASEGVVAPAQSEPGIDLPPTAENALAENAPAKPKKLTAKQIKEAAPQLTDEEADVAAALFGPLLEDVEAELVLEPATTAPKLVQGTLLQNSESRDSILYQESEEDTKGHITFAAETGKAWIKLNKSGDISTFSHEVAHFMRRFIINPKNAQAVAAARRRGITDQELTTLAEWAGAKNGVWGEDAEEKFARAIEKYLREGNAPNAQLQPLFDKLSKWLKGIYTSIKNSSIDIEITPDVQAIFDKLFAGPQEQVATPKAGAPKPAKKKLPPRRQKLDLVGARRAMNEETRARLGIPASRLKVASISDQEAIDSALADIVENENYEKATSEQQKLLPEPPRVGKALVDHLTFNPELAPLKGDTALLVHESIQAEKAVDTARNKLEKMSDPQASDFNELERAREYLRDVLDLLQFRGSQAGLALQAYKLVTDRQFNREILLSDYHKWQNTGKAKKDWTPVDPEKVKELEKFAEEAKAKFAEAERLEKIYRDKIAEQEAAQLLALQKKTAKPRATPVHRTMTERVKERAAAARPVLARFQRLSQMPENKVNARHADLEAKYNAGTITPAERREAEKIVEEKAKKAGYSDKGFHGTVERWTNYVFGKNRSTSATDEAIYVTDSEEEATVAASPDKRKAVVMKLFTKTTNPLIIDAKGTEKERSFGKAGYKKAIEIAKAQGKDSIVVKNVVDFGNTPQTTTILFDSSQIKSADPFTGVPLDQRFNPEISNILYQSPENSLTPDELEAFAAVGAEYLTNGARTLDDFTKKLTEEFPGAEAFAEQIFDASKAALQKSAAGSSRKKSPQELASLTDPDKALSPRMIYNMAGGLIEQGFEGKAILDKIVELLKPSIPELTRDDVVLAYTGYGKAKFPNPETKLNRENRNLELIGKQLEVAETGVLPEKSGPQRDPTTPKVRALRDAFHAVVRDLGLKSASDKKQMRGSLDSIKTRFKNDIADIKLAIAENRKLAAKVKNKTEYDTELKNLKAEKNRQVKIYNTTFGIDSKKVSMEQRLASAERALDREIAREEEMALKGILDRPKPTPLAATPAMKLKQARLKKLTDARRAEKKRLRQKAKELLNPTKTAAQRATESLGKGLQKQIARFEYFLKNGKMPDSTKEKTTYERETFPTELFKTKEDLQEAIAWLKADAKKLPLSQKLKKNRTIAQLEKLRDVLEKQINSRNWDKLAAVKGAVDPREQSIKETIKILRGIKEQTQKLDPAWVQSREQKLEARLIEAAKTEREKWQGKLDRGEFFDEAKIKREPSAALVKARYETEQVKQKWLDERRQRLLANKGFVGQVGYWSLAALDLRKILFLGLDLTLGRQGLLGFLTRPFITIKNWGKALTYLTAEREQGLWDMVHDPLRTPAANFYKINKQWKLFGPHEESKLRGKEDVPDPELLKKIAGSKIIGVNYAAQAILVLERLNRVHNNLTTVDIFSNLLQIAPDNTPTKKDVIIAANASMVAMGRGSFQNTTMDTGVGLMNYLFISTRYMLARAQLAAFQPLWASRGAGYEGTLKMRSRVATQIYGKMLLSTATVMGVLGMIFFGDDEEKWKAYTNPLSNSFGVITINGIDYKPLAGMFPYITILAKLVMGYKIKDGKVVPLRGEDSGHFKGSIEDEWQQFQDNRRNINYSLAMEIAAGKHYGGEKLTTLSVASRLLGNINLKNDFEIINNHQASPLQKAFTIGMVHAGFSANVKKELKAAKKSEIKVRY